jgi:hypothetical protein
VAFCGSNSVGSWSGILTRMLGAAKLARRSISKNPSSVPLSSVFTTYCLCMCFTDCRECVCVWVSALHALRIYRCSNANVDTYARIRGILNMFIVDFLRAYNSVCWRLSDRGFSRCFLLRENDAVKAAEVVPEV